MDMRVEPPNPLFTFFVFVFVFVLFSPFFKHWGVGLQNFFSCGPLLAFCMRTSW